MKIGSRNFLILKEIIENKNHITGKVLEEKFKISRKQLSYGIEKINEYLRCCGYSEIKRFSNGEIHIAEDVVKGVDLFQLEQENQELWFSKQERIDIICIMLLTSKEELSLVHFTSELKVSRNTVLLDLKKIDSDLKEKGLKLEYDRKEGYMIQGNKYEQRQLLFWVLSNLVPKYQSYPFLRRICNITRENVDGVREILMQIEEKLKIRFAGEMVEINCYLFAIIFIWIQEGRVLEEIPESFLHIVGTKEYAIIKLIVEKKMIRNIYEVMYLTAHIQSMKIEMVLWERDELKTSVIQSAVEETIENYEKLACVSIEDKEELKNMLIRHCEPALYRIKYNFHVELDITEYILPEYQELHNIVGKAVEPLEILVEKKIPEKELVYISLIIGSHMKKECYKEMEDRRPEALVVCQNGITVSRFLCSSLENIFPEIQFKQCMSVKQFERYEKQFDIVFTTVVLKTDKKMFVISPLIDEKSKKALRERVSKIFREEGLHFPRQEMIMKLVKRYVSEQSYQRLCSEIDRYIFNEEKERERFPRELHLSELLTDKTIRIAEEKMGWKVAIEFASIPLVYSNIIQKQYVESMIYNILNQKPDLEIADGVIIAHAGIDQGVNDIGMSLLVLPEKITILDYLKADIIIVLAAVDYESHLLALKELIQILEDEKKLEQIRHARRIDEVLKIL